ncbi:UBX domain-containing protein 8-like [Littorina saxatilis]|uniref:UBX domain-containing protein n=1 Tax=Littorina saxatilis TaxID=31220 RepID=A0AAN9BTY3_9CAEN
MDPETSQLVQSAVRWIARGALSLALVTFLIQWLLPRLRKCYHLHTHTASNTGNNNEADSQERVQKQHAVRQDLQNKHSTKAASYKERILLPREEAKKQQQDEEFYKFLGPAWKGKGEALGKDEGHGAEQAALDEFEEDLNPREMAAVRRRIQKPTPQPPKPPEKPKRIINLPEEPAERDPESVLVLLRSPIQTVYQRRFAHSDTVQTLLDFMTVSGFTQSYNTLCTSYPRHDLGKNKAATLLDLGFTKRVTLNIEEIEL